MVDTFSKYGPHSINIDSAVEHVSRKLCLLCFVSYIVCNFKWLSTSNFPKVVWQHIVSEVRIITCILFVPPAKNG